VWALPQAGVVVLEDILAVVVLEHMALERLRVQAQVVGVVAAIVQVVDMVLAQVAEVVLAYLVKALMGLVPLVILLVMQEEAAVVAVMVLKGLHVEMVELEVHMVVAVEDLINMVVHQHQGLVERFVLFGQETLEHSHQLV
jgi:hypothetical protein